MYQFRIPSLFRTIAQDATGYFLLVFTSHLALELAQILGRPSIQLLPATGNIVFIPIMITRLTLSLRKASASQKDVRSFWEPTTATDVRFAGCRGFEVTGHGIGLGTFGGGREGARGVA
ncbi:hypothetical protein BDM02DRAFT_1244016 [Thelephora ganbajun]|uniref:Uncharacterized protein n=1 Tax=Thelephora ganbajun TaxID=370292 RepID=A0ACB6Z415_THEGA|nr:hypothetical protein BDM02DRAFT_1244016 [Thelephora ganbajun]